MEVTAGGEVTAVNNGADVSPFGVHRTRGVNDERKFDLATAGVVPGDLNVVVCIHYNIWVPFVPNDWGEQGVVKESDNGSCGWVRLKHAVVNLRLVEETIEFVIGVLPYDVGVSLAVQINGWPVAVLGAHRDDVVVDRTYCAVVACRSVHRRSPRVEDRVDNFVLA